MYIKAGIICQILCLIKVKNTVGLKCENSANNSYFWMRLQNNMPGIRFEFFFLHSISKIVDFYLCWFCWLCVSWHILTGRQVLFGLPIITYFFIFPECHFFAYVMSGFFNQFYIHFYNSDDINGIEMKKNMMAFCQHWIEN